MAIRNPISDREYKENIESIIQFSSNKNYWLYHSGASEKQTMAIIFEMVGPALIVNNPIDQQGQF